MPDQDLPCADLYARPAEIDEGTYLRIRQMRPVERAAAPIIDHNIELTETALSVRGWYRGETRVEPGSYMSILLDPGRNNAVGFLDEFVRTVKAFPPGAFPGHCHAVRELEFTSAHLINALSTLVDAAVFAQSLRHLGALFAAFSDPANRTLSAHDLRQRIDSRLALLVDSFRAISREFAMREREILFRSLPSEQPLAEKADEILAVATETRQIARETQKVAERIDAREVKRGKRRQDVEMQDRCFVLWESGRAKECVRSAANGKVSYEAVFNYYRRELEAMGVTSSAQFSRALTNRAKRLSRAKSLDAQVRAPDAHMRAENAPLRENDAHVRVEKIPTKRDGNGIISNMKNATRNAVVLALSIVGAMAAPLRSDASPDILRGGGWIFSAKSRSGLLLAA